MFYFVVITSQCPQFHTPRVGRGPQAKYEGTARDPPVFLAKQNGSCTAKRWLFLGAKKYEEAQGLPQHDIHSCLLRPQLYGGQSDGEGILRCTYYGDISRGYSGSHPRIHRKRKPETLRRLPISPPPHHQTV